MDRREDALCDIYPVEDFFFLLSKGPDLISKVLKQGSIWEPLTLELSKLLIENVASPVLVDIGANLGAWTVPMGKHTLPKEGKVFSFEPQRPVFYQLCANVFLNNLINCHVNNLAVGGFCGDINIPLLDIHNFKNVGALSLCEKIREEQGWIRSLEHFESARIATLDSLLLPKAHLVKIDVEGLELEVLQGGRKWLQYSGYPPVLFEVWGDYMKGMINKKAILFDLIKNDFGYVIYSFGELCVAQHPQNGIIKIDDRMKYEII